MERLKRRWGITSNWQVAVILVVFALTGSTAVLIKKPLLALLGLESPAWWLSLLIVLIAYQFLLLFYGALLGQFRFFWEFEKRMFSRLWPRGRRPR